MIENKNNKRGRRSLYNLAFVFFIVLLIISNYPLVYGKDSFGVMWMTTTLKWRINSKNSRLILLCSYFDTNPSILIFSLSS